MTDETFEETFTRLRARYLEKARERCDGLEALLASVDGADTPASVIEDIRQSFHKFSGSGATYGFPRVSELGLDGELWCDAILKRESGVEGDDVERLRRIVTLLRPEFDE